MRVIIDAAPFMTQCTNCGQANSDNSHFCRFCGQRFAERRPESYDIKPPRPYAWKTDEYQTLAEARTAPEQVQSSFPAPANIPVMQSLQQLTYRGPQDLSGNYRCPFCHTNFLPVMERRVSTAGWITFGLLMLFTVVFFWIGLLLKENVAICPICKRQVA